MGFSLRDQCPGASAGDGEFNGDGGALAGAGAGGADGAAVEFDDLAGDGEAEAEAAVAAGEGGVGLAEAFEDVGEEAGWMPSPVSTTSRRATALTRDMRTVTRPPRGVNLTALVMRFQTTCWGGPGSRRGAAGRRRRGLRGRRRPAAATGRTVDGTADEGGEVDIAEVKAEVPAVTAAETSRRSSTRLSLGLGALDDGSRAAWRSASGTRPASSMLGPEEDGGEGGAELVAGGGEEVVLGLAARCGGRCAVVGRGRAATRTAGSTGWAREASAPASRPVTLSSSSM